MKRFKIISILYLCEKQIQNGNDFLEMIGEDELF